MAQLSEQVGLDELGLRQRRGHFQQWFIGEHESPFWDRTDLTVESQAQ